MRLSRIILFLLICALITNTFSSLASKEETICNSHSDCSSCFECSLITQKCSPVMAYTDPHNDCTDICEVYTVCGENQHCILTSTPDCDCDWVSGGCIKDPPLIKLETVEIVSSSSSKIDQFNDIEVGNLNDSAYNENDIQDNSNNDHHHSHQKSFYIYIGSLVILSVILFVIYAQYKNKQRNTRHNLILNNTKNGTLQKNMMQSFLVVDSSSTNDNN